MQIDLARKATLVNLSISQWYNKKTEPRALRPVSDAFNNANVSEDKYVKTLVPVRAMEAIGSCISQTRKYHLRTTLAWDNEGLRILPAVMFFEYTQKMGEFKMKLENLVLDFMARYPQLVHNAKIVKSGLFIESDYPDVEELRGAFEIRTTFMPFPSGQDFRLEIDDKLVEQLRSDTTREFESRVVDAVADVRNRFKEYLTDWDAAITAGSTRKSHAQKLRALCDIAPKQNLIGDEKLTQMVARCEGLLTETDPQFAQIRIKEILKEAA